MEMRKTMLAVITVDDALEYLEPINQFPSLNKLKQEVFCRECTHNNRTIGINWANPEEYIDIPCDECTIQSNGEEVTFSMFQPV